MNRHKIFQEQLEKALKDYENAKEIEKLTQRHTEVNRQIRDKNYAAINKLENGEDISDAEQEEINNLGKQQEELHRELAAKIIEKHQKDNK